MALKPIPLTTDSADEDSPKGAIPVEIYGVGGDSGPVTWGDVQDKPSEFPPEDHTHSAEDVDSGTFAVARIPDLTQSKISGLEARLSDIEDRLEALEP